MLDSATEEDSCKLDLRISKGDVKFLYFNHLLVHFARYIQRQASPTNRATCDYHFFNTYFYNKLKEVVSYKVVVSLGFLISLSQCFQLLML